VESSFERAAPVATLPYLAPAPRRVPLGLRARLLFGGTGVFAWLWLALTVPLTAPFLRNTDVASWLLFRLAPQAATGTVDHCEGTGASEGGGKGSRGTPVFANHYRFTAGGAEHAGVSYATGECLDPDLEVPVEWVAGRPEVSRIAGMRRSEFGAGALVAALFPAVGIAMALGAALVGRRRLRLLSGGRLALGTLLASEPTNTRVNGRPVMRLRFELTTDRGTRHEVVVRTTAAAVLQDEPRERIFYDPARPERAVPWDLLPGRPALDGTGNLRPPAALGTVLVLLPPLVACAAVALAVGL
jgi:hypothetical protein